MLACMSRLKMNRVWLWLLPVVIAVPILGWTIYAAVIPRELRLHGTAVENQPHLHDVALIDHEGMPRQLADWQDKLLVVFFGYTECPDVCAPTMARLASTYERLGEPDGLRVVMISVDPERDTPERIKLYVESFHPDFVGLTGSPEALVQTASRFYVGSFQRRDGLVSHTSSVFLLDRESRMRLIYNQDKLDEMLEEDLRTILAQGGSW